MQRERKTTTDLPECGLTASRSKYAVQFGRELLRRPVGGVYGRERQRDFSLKLKGFKSFVPAVESVFQMVKLA